MSEIKKGDLVAIVKPGCKNNNVGKIFTVLGVSDERFSCLVCGKHHGYGKNALRLDDGIHRYWVAFSRLRKIDPDQASDHEREFDRLSRKEQHPLVVGDLDTQRRIMDESLAGSNNRS